MTCRKARGLLLKLGARLESRDLGKDRTAEVDELMGERDYEQFLNPRNELYRSRKLQQPSIDGQTAESDSSPHRGI
jgi:hypothetical protein